MKLRFLGKINKELNRLTVTAVALAVLAVVVLIVYLAYQTKDDTLELVTSDKIDPTPTVIREIREIGEWEFLSIADEEMVDTLRKGIFSDDELIRIYYGTLRLGIDFSKCDETWISLEDDSIRLNLPPVALLDEQFIDETRTKPFFEKGKWSNEARKALYEKARRQMLARCLTKENKKQAQENAEREVVSFIEKLKLKVKKN